MDVKAETGFATFLSCVTLCCIEGISDEQCHDENGKEKVTVAVLDLPLISGARDLTIGAAER